MKPWSDPQLNPWPLYCTGARTPLCVFYPSWEILPCFPSLFSPTFQLRRSYLSLDKPDSQTLPSWVSLATSPFMHRCRRFLSNHKGNVITYHIQCKKNMEEMWNMVEKMWKSFFIPVSRYTPYKIYVSLICGFTLFLYKRDSSVDMIPWIAFDKSLICLC